VKRLLTCLNHFECNGDFSPTDDIGDTTQLAGEYRSEVNLQHMRKRLIAPTSPCVRFDRDHPLDVSTTASVEVTSEEHDYPIESALIPGQSKGWRASEPGTQTIRLIFDRPQKLERISLVFEEKETSRTQEFALRWSPSPEGAWREIVRQQWNFSPPRTTTEVEEYRVELSDVTVLEMAITPDIGGGAARASLNSFALY
jgi:hypothetical protein